MPPVFSMASPMLWLVRLTALTALTASWWLTFQKWLAPRVSIAGCGGSEGCVTVLESRWSQWFFLPVTLLSATIWMAVLLLTLPSVSNRLGRTADQLLAACAVLLIAGALWFGTLMLAVVRVWCPWCLSLHLAAILVGGILLYSTWRTSRSGGEQGIFAAASQAGIAGAALLVLGQLFGKVPDTHLITSESPSTIAEVLPVLPDRVSYLDGTVTLLLREVPLIGSPQATHLLTSLSDYTCVTCRAQHSDLKALLKAEPDTYAVLVLTTPLERACNPHLPAGARDHVNACVTARLALAVWQAAPERFAEFHSFLMGTPLPIDPAVAMAEAVRLVPDTALVPDSPYITARLKENADIYQRLSTTSTKLPKLILAHDKVLHGAATSRERFLEVIQESFSSGINPPTGELIRPIDHGVPVTTPVR